MSRMRVKDTLLEQLDEMPPRLVRLLARRKDKHFQPLTNIDIAKASGLNPKKVSKIGKLDSWRTLTIDEIDRFRSGCGVTPKNMKWHRAYLKRTLSGKIPMAHLRHRKAKTKFIKSITT